MKVFSALLLCLGLLTGCVSTSRNGPAHTFEFSQDKAAVKNAIINTYLAKGFIVIKDSEYLLVLDKPAKRTLGVLFLYGTAHNAPRVRNTLTITETEKVKIYARIEGVLHPGRNFEQVIQADADPKARKELYEIMDAVKANLDK